VDARKYRIVIDLEGVEFLDSTGLAVLVGGLKRVKENNGVLAICCTKDQILRVFSLTGLNKVFPIHGTIEEATASA
jgi:anti-sigma B factor antagonist